MIRHPRLSIALLVVFHSTLLILSLVRRDVQTVDRRVVAFAVAWAGALLPLLLRPAASGVDPLAGQALQVVGLALQIAAMASLGRSFGVVAADRGIQTGGAYRFVRHPIYAASLFADVGFVMSHPTAANIAILSAATATQIIRIWFEERHLSASPEYAEYCRIRRWRLVPGIW
jgi:protein-S-isoprenylcysteine O-methyltransferase Ste14